MAGRGNKSRGGDVVFSDEFGWSFLERLRRTWAPRSQRPIVRRVTKHWRVLTTIAGLTLSGRIIKRHFVGGMKSCHMSEVLEHLRRNLPAGSFWSAIMRPFTPTGRC